MGFIKSFFKGLGKNEDQPVAENISNSAQPQNTVTENTTNSVNTDAVEKKAEPESSVNNKNVEKTAQGEAVNKQQTSGKMQIYNLIIVDESGSMMGLRDVTMSGINETISTIREAQKQYADKQEHFLTLVTFDERRDRNVPAVRTIIDGLPIDKVSDFKDYSPQGCTPLYDAMGDSLTKLREKIRGIEDATGVVTILTDGLENASHHWRPEALRKLIEQLKEEGWTFSYMGSAHDVKEVTDLLAIDNVMEFSHNMTGASNTWGRERSSKRAYFSRMACEFNADESWEEKKARRRQYNKEYYGERVTPDNIRSLQPNEIFVFGSNAEGHHGGGAAMAAFRFFGAQWGRGEGIQGQSYAIPTTNGMELMRDAIHRFCIFAGEHPEKKFFVTRIGCGIAGYNPSDVAPLFKEAIELENIALPQDFWEILGLRMFNSL